MTGFRARYGAAPLHLLAVVVSVAISGYAAVRIFGGSKPLSVVIWLAGAVLAHDLLAFPVYSLLSRIAFGRAGESRSPRIVAAANHIRVPAFLSGIFLLVWFPLIFGLTDRYEGNSGLAPSGYLAKWLLLSAALFLISSIAYAVRLRVGERLTPG